MNENVAQLLLLQDTMDAIRQRVVDAVLSDEKTKRRLNRIGFDTRNESNRLIAGRFDEEGLFVDVIKDNDYFTTLPIEWTPAMISAINGQVNRESPSILWTQE